MKRKIDIREVLVLALSFQTVLGNFTSDDYMLEDYPTNTDGKTKQVNKNRIGDKRYPFKILNVGPPPDHCIPHCNPTCVNGGECIGTDTCKCINGFKGPRCEYDPQTCNIRQTGFHEVGNFNCLNYKHSAECTFSCLKRGKLEGPSKSSCDYKTGRFLPKIGTCTYPSILKRIEKPKPKESSMEKGRTIDTPNGYQLYKSPPVSRSATCSVWSANNVKTFDGKVFRAPMSCSYMLVQDRDRNFGVVLKTCPYQTRADCSYEIKVSWNTYLLTLKNIDGHARLFDKYKEQPISMRIKGLKFAQVQQDVVITTNLGLSIVWDRHQYVSVTAEKDINHKRVEGICGYFDDRPKNDFTGSKGLVLEKPKEFLDSWKVKDNLAGCLNDYTCEEKLFSDCPDKEKAEEICKSLFSNPNMKECLEPFNKENLMADCIRDYCNCQNKAEPETCNCQTIDTLVKECMFRGLKVQRSSKICHMADNTSSVLENDYPTLTNDSTEMQMDYMNDLYVPEDVPQVDSQDLDYDYECPAPLIWTWGPPEPPTCGSVVVPFKPDEKVENCFCPEDTIRYKDNCIAVAACPCQHGSTEYKPGEQRKQLCNTCTCTNGFWVCTTKDCSRRCTATGDPHYTTFDGRAYNFMGKGQYYLLKAEGLTVIGDNVFCYSNTVSCTASMTIRTNLFGRLTTVVLGRNNLVRLNGQDVKNLPKHVEFSQIIIKKEGKFLTATLSNGLRVLYDGGDTAYIDASPEFYGKTSGLCGTINDNTQDDYTTPEGNVEQSENAFCEKWKVRDTDEYLSDDPGSTGNDTMDYLSDQAPDVDVPAQRHPCDESPHMRETAEELCYWLKDDLFLDCQNSVDVDVYYENCLFDICASGDHAAEYFCSMISVYADECSRQGMPVAWRNHIKECAIECPVGQVYEECGDVCTRTCYDIGTFNGVCEWPCIAGCRCPEGEYLNHKDECVPLNECGCTYKGIVSSSGYKEVRSGTSGPDLCTCEGGIWKCVKAAPEDNSNYPAFAEVSKKCASTPFAEFSLCVPNHPMTCTNMDDYVENLEDCEPGCMCQKGYVYDSTTKECVQPEDCSCHHGGRSFTKGGRMIEDCNICLCNSGKWKCTANKCEATCSVWGDSHYTTFDDHDFDFQGACDYILSKGVAANGDSFSITIQNVLCGSLGVTCSKSMRIALEGSVTDTINLGENMELFDEFDNTSIVEKLQKQVSGNGHSYNIYRAGVFVVLEVIPLQIQIKWDEGTRIYVRLGIDWVGKVKGLCGNYNHNSNDDMRTPAGDRQMNPMHFGHSWKTHEFCPPPTQLEDSCKANPTRETWAKSKCSIIKSSLFKACHSKVPFEKYLKRCIFDTCACDQGGDCECLCTAIAAYAYACSMKGIAIPWRTPHLCPMQCGHQWAQYKACTPICGIETCDNFLDQEKPDRMCLRENCIEGCQIKPCEEGMIFLNESFTECVPKSDCKPLCMQKDGKTFYESDMTLATECQTCWCTNKKESCIGKPCFNQLADTTKPEPRQLQNKCTPGWTKWLSLKLLSAQDKLPTFDRYESTYGSCEKKFMKRIECRQVNNPKESAITCKLEGGVICRGNCDNYETRVFCGCESEETESVLNAPPIELAKTCDPATEEYKEYAGDCYKFLHCQMKTDGIWSYVERTCGSSLMFNPKRLACDDGAAVELLKPTCKGTSPVKLICPSGKVWSNCANHCGQTCHFYEQSLIKRGLCNIGDVCKPGCVDETEPNCLAANKVWRDRNTCVGINECPCMSNDDQYVKPYSTFRQDDSQTCQCIENVLLCEDYAEKVQEVTTPTPELKPKVNKNRQYKCDPDDAVNLTDGDEPLPDEAFSASSTLSDSHLPHFARLHSDGCWSPKVDEQLQYLKINFKEPKIITGIIVQGDPKSDRFVTRYRVEYSSDANAVPIKDLNTLNNVKDIFKISGSTDEETPTETIFQTPVVGNSVIIYPLEWHKGIALRVEIVGCDMDPADLVTPEVPEIITTTAAPSPGVKPEYVDPIGLDSGAIDPTQVTASSICPRPSGEKQSTLLEILKLSSIIGWKPVLNSKNTYVQIDYLTPTIFTGVITKGGREGWVTNYRVVYSNNGFIWNNCENSRIFRANNDRDTPRTNYFKAPIRTRMIKVIPTDWHKNINMRMELLGKPVPRPKVNRKIKVIETKPISCPVCDNIITNPNDKECKCKNPLLWDGTRCVNQHQCPCVEKLIRYPVGAKFETNNDCQECSCLLGGVKHCQPKQCPRCKPGLRNVYTSTCMCKCEECPKLHKLCPSSGDCIPNALWCDGVQNCEDDETPGCKPISEVVEETTIEVTTTESFTTTERNDLKSECPNGMITTITDPLATRKMAEIFSVTNYLKSNIPERVNRVENLALPLPKLELGNNEPEHYPEYLCTPTAGGTIPTCPDEYILHTTPTMKPSEFACLLRPYEDRICELSGSFFTTFDGTKFKYDVCSQILARSLNDLSWYIAVQSICEKDSDVCHKELIIKDMFSDSIITIRPKLKVQFNEVNPIRSVSALQLEPLAMSGFIITSPGDSILVVSPSNGFWVLYDKMQRIKIGVSEKNMKNVDGMCGYFNGNPADDKRHPDGTTASSTDKFGDSWYDQKIPQNKCHSQVYSGRIQNSAFRLCNEIGHPSFQECRKAVNPNEFMAKCIETTSAFLLANKNDRRFGKCTVLQKFVSECLAINPKIKMDTWRAVHNCEISCPAPKVLSDCNKRRCNTLCDFLKQDDCTMLSDVCFSGCYCPEGTVMQGTTCIPATKCKDCKCDTSTHIEYDRKKFTSDGKCTYLLSRNIVLPNVDKFMVHATMDYCKNLRLPSNGDRSICVKSLRVLYRDHMVHFQRTLPNKPLQALVDGVEVNRLTLKDTWLEITNINEKKLKFKLPESHVEVTSSFEEMKFSIHVSGGIKRGFRNEMASCDCPTDLPKEPTAKCLNEEVLTENCVTLSTDNDPCLKLLNEDLFGKCHKTIDPAMYISICQQNLCKASQKGVCQLLTRYANECSRHGICLDWRSEDFCPYECPAHLTYKPCASPKTCETIKVDNRGNGGKTEGCFCPDDKVLDNDRCVVKEQCTRCHDGVHSVGETWKKNKCTECNCNKDAKTECIEKQCPVIESICPEGFTPTTISSPEDCCPKYNCVPEPRDLKPSTCPKAPVPQCGPGQFTKQKIGSDGCPRFICECKPASECGPLKLIRLKDGEQVVLDDSGCCPVQKVVCDPRTCPKREAIKCEKFFKSQVIHHPGDCCPTVECSPPATACIVEVKGILTLKNLEDKWVDPTNTCVQNHCTLGYKNKPQINRVIEICKTDCPKGFEYKHLDKTKCCGICVQTKCVFNNNLYLPGEKWSSPDKCTTYSCTDVDGFLLINRGVEICPDTSNCRPEHLETRGCCKICKVEPESLKNCLPVSLVEEKTKKIIQIPTMNHGTCVNEEPIREYTVCKGFCESGSRLNPVSSVEEKDCVCCSVTGVKTVSILLRCRDGYKFGRDIDVPSECGCKNCSEPESLLSVRVG